MIISSELSNCSAKLYFPKFTPYCVRKQFHTFSSHLKFPRSPCPFSHWVDNLISYFFEKQKKFLTILIHYQIYLNQYPHSQLASCWNGWTVSCSPAQEDPLEKEMATHSSILAWRIPWTEEPGGLQSVESHRVGHDWATGQPPPTG